jgi:Flp pilus assembly protein TadD
MRAAQRNGPRRKQQVASETDRIDSMRKFVESRPDEPFPRYGLAMEYAKHGRLEEADEQFAELRRRNPEYLPLYYQHGSVLMRLERKDEARSTFEKGIELSTAKGDEHTRDELTAILGELGK